MNALALWLPNPLFCIRDIPVGTVHTIQVNRVRDFSHVMDAAGIGFKDLLMVVDDDDDNEELPIKLSEDQKKQLRLYVDEKSENFVRQLQHIFNEHNSGPFRLYCEYPFIKSNDECFNEYFCPVLIHIARHAPNMRVLNFCLHSLEVLHFDGKLQEFMQAIGSDLTVIHIEEMHRTRMDHLETKPLQVFVNFLDVLSSLLDLVLEYCPKMTIFEAHGIPYPMNDDYDSIDCLDGEEETGDVQLERDDRIRKNVRTIGKRVLDCQKSVENLRKEMPHIEMESIVENLEEWAAELKSKDEMDVH